MTKKIKTLEDLADISGTASAELGLKQTKTKKAKTKNVVIGESKSSKNKSTSKKTKKKTTAHEVQEISNHMPTHSQLFPIDYDELLKKPYVLSHVQKKQTVKELEKFVSQAESRSQHFMDIYQRHLLLGDEYRGFKIVAINILREARAIKKFLSEQKQSA